MIKKARRDGPLGPQRENIQHLIPVTEEERKKLY